MPSGTWMLRRSCPSGDSSFSITWVIPGLWISRTIMGTSMAVMQTTRFRSTRSMSTSLPGSLARTTMGAVGVDFLHCEGDGDALVIGAGVDDDLAGVLHAGAGHDIVAGRFAAHEVDEIGEWIALGGLRAQDDFRAARLPVGDQVLNQRGGLSAAISEDDNVAFHIESQQTLFPAA